MERVKVLIGLALMAAGAPLHAATSDEAELIRLEHAYARALMNKDMAFLRAYYAPEWRGGNWQGFITKARLISKVQDRRYVVKSMVLRDVRVRVLGATAIVQGVDDEVTSMSGRDTSGIWLWTDVFARRNGRWVAVASQTTELQPQ